MDKYIVICGTHDEGLKFEVCEQHSIRMAELMVKRSYVTTCGPKEIDLIIEELTQLREEI